MKSQDQMQADIDRLRAALRGLMDATANVHTKKANDAQEIAREVWRDTASAEQKARAVRIAQRYNPAIQSFDEAMQQYGTQLLTME